MSDDLLSCVHFVAIISGICFSNPSDPVNVLRSRSATVLSIKSKNDNVTTKFSVFSVYSPSFIYQMLTVDSLPDTVLCQLTPLSHRIFP